MEKKRVYIDLGHFGDDNGIVGFNYIFESKIIKEVSDKLKELLVEKYIVRCSTDIGDNASLSQRSKDIKEWNSDIVVSLHCNALDGNHHGIETCIYDNEDRELANCIHGNIVNKKLYTKNNGISVKNYHIVRECNIGCIIFLGYIDNKDDYQLIVENYTQFAEAIYQGINDYFNQED